MLMEYCSSLALRHVGVKLPLLLLLKFPVEMLRSWLFWALLVLHQEDSQDALNGLLSPRCTKLHVSPQPARKGIIQGAQQEDDSLPFLFFSSFKAICFSDLFQNMEIHK